MYNGYLNEEQIMSEIKSHLVRVQITDYLEVCYVLPHSVQFLTHIGSFDVDNPYLQVYIDQFKTDFP